MKALPAEWRPYNILRISNTDANNKDWILMSTQQTSSLSTSMTKVQMNVSTFLQSRLPVSLMNMCLVCKAHKSYKKTIEATPKMIEEEVAALKTKIARLKD